MRGFRQEYEFFVVNHTPHHDSLSLIKVQFTLQTQEMRLEQLHGSNAFEANIAHFQKNSTGSGQFYSK